jgi:hypothetical protein
MCGNKVASDQAGSQEDLPPLPAGVRDCEGDETGLVQGREAWNYGQ